MPEPPPPPPSLPAKELPINRYKFIWRVLMISNLVLGGQPASLSFRLYFLCDFLH
ncbi:hypothetical protein C1H46_026798 [Malus baccata]|uniref:Uncharacterized protein n=1 Tax=Malus baccata TaxID=106549 RepID=A0A540LMP8_MALBA|nr:hypothetical protein C1H46_026798 [Malus baccata]